MCFFCHCDADTDDKVKQKTARLQLVDIMQSIISELQPKLVHDRGCNLVETLEHLNIGTLKHLNI